MKQFAKFGLILCTTILFSSCDQARKFEERARVVNNYERTALVLEKENRELRAQLSGLKFEVQTLKSQNKYLEMQIQQQKGVKRDVASVGPVHPENDLVKYDVYKWKAEQMLAVAQKEFEEKNFEKSAQFFETYLRIYGRSQKIPDTLLFQSGLAAYESGNHHPWAIEHFSHIIENFPTSPYFKGAKLWKAMAQLHSGNEKEFFATVEEFRKKYRNTQEWEILSGHYENILQKYKK